MGFSAEAGYIPASIDSMMLSVMNNINTQFGLTYTPETFLGTNFYKYFYALIQRLQENEVKTSEIFLRLQEYFVITNEKIQRPNTTHPGIFDFFQSKGYFVSTKPPIDADAGKAFICVDLVDNHARGKITITDYANLVSGTDDELTIGSTTFTAQTGAATEGDDTFQAATSNEATAASLALQINTHATEGALVYAQAIENEVWIRYKVGGTGGNSYALVYTDNDTNVGATVSAATLLGWIALEDGELDYDEVRLAVCNIIKDCVVAGVVSQGSEVEEIVLTNGQSFLFKFNLPKKIPILLRLTIVQSENNLFTILAPDAIAQKLFNNINEKYRLGKNFEPQRYFTVVDAPWAAEITLEWSDDDGANWYSSVFDSEYDEIFTFALDDIEIVEA